MTLYYGKTVLNVRLMPYILASVAINVALKSKFYYKIECYYLASRCVLKIVVAPDLSDLISLSLNQTAQKAKELPLPDI